MSSRWHPPKKTTVEEITPKPNWLELPRDITANILHRLGAYAILMNARNVCPLWWNICKDPIMWRTIDMGMKYTFLLPQGTQSYISLGKMCSYAVDLSCGQLEDISIFRFCSDDLLNYIANRASHLRRISIDNCVWVSDEGMCEVANKLSSVEELYITHNLLVSNIALEVLGRSCPLLKSLSYCGSSWQSGIMCDDEAFAIAKTMPTLRYLDINGNPLSDVGLIAILDGCPLLESLDIRNCHNLEFSGNLWKRCQDQIKDLRRFVNYSDYFSDFDTDNEDEDEDSDFISD